MKNKKNCKILNQWDSISSMLFIMMPGNEDRKGAV